MHLGELQRVGRKVKNEVATIYAFGKVRARSIREVAHIVEVFKSAVHSIVNGNVLRFFHYATTRRFLGHPVKDFP